MVSKKGLDCDLLEYGGAPVIPKAPRSVRKHPRKKFPEDGNLLAFELLASVAEKLLEESESSASSNASEEEKVKPCAELDGSDKTPPISDDKGLISESSLFQENGKTEKFDSYTELGILEDIKKDDGSIYVGNSSNDNTIDSERRGYSDSSKTSHVKDRKQECVNNSTMVNNTKNGVQFPLYRGVISRVDRWRNVQLGSRDDDEKSYVGNRVSSAKFRSSFRSSQPRFLHSGIAKKGSSRFRIAAHKMKDSNPYNNREAMKLFYRYRKNSYAPIRKRRLTYYNADYHQSTSCDSVSNSPNKGLSSTKKIHQKATDSKVKLKIKSFFVPELYIDVAETDTVGSLKRAVMDAVNALLGGGIRVGVVLKGRKCRDDKRTLQNVGISEGSNLDTLGFTLEPKHNNRSPRSASTVVVESGLSNAMADQRKPDINIDDENININNHTVPSPRTPPNNEYSDNIGSKALVPFHAMDAEPLAMIPLKPKASELSQQRRTRRPFSVAEVEALVSAVEKLGTGRWRDVKVRAFENADHRTYVDLKDKWKTLVHTASISPQQRRGEPVPQELLDRVLSAHSYWSQHQSKHHGKNSNSNESPLKMVSFCEEISQA